MTEPGNEQIAILIVDDERAVRDSLTTWFREDGFTADNAADGKEALSKLETDAFDIVLLDIKMPGMDGMELLKKIRESWPDIVVVMITAFASVDTAVKALKDGAFDYVTKPFDPDDLNRLVRSAVQQRALLLENRRLKSGIEALSMVDEIVGESDAIKQVMELVASVSKTDATVLVRGETGTGKELVARAIHANSKRRYAPIITMNCGAVPDDLLESELFGHERGAFTGASQQRRGKLELANGGTLFLDEVGNISARMQIELLRVLETKRFMRLGGSREIEVDFRLVSATNADLETYVREGRFREDLYYRLNVFRIEIPPLRARHEDIAPLAIHFFEGFRHAMGKNVRRITPEGLELLSRYDWPGNARELRNVIERAIVVCAGDEVGVKHLRYQFPAFSRGGEPAESPDTSDSDALTTGNESLAEVERAHISRVLEVNQGNVSKSARVLGIDRVTLYNKIKKYDIER